MPPTGPCSLFIIDNWSQLLVIVKNEKGPGHAVCAEEHTVSGNHMALPISFLVLTVVFGPKTGQKIGGLIEELIGMG